MAVVQYAQWRDHEQQRIQTNDTVMGLLTGSKLAAQVLNLTAGSSLTLSQIFPQVAHIGRFNLRTDRAQQVLDDAENLLGILAVPQILALHEDLLKGMCELLKIDGIITASQLRGVKTATMHGTLEKAVPPDSFTSESVELFHLVRIARNTHIHNGGRVNHAFSSSLASVSPAALTAWRAITGEPFPTYSLGDPVRLGLLELTGILAVTKRLAEEANAMFQLALPRSRWADMLVTDWLPSRRPGNRTQIARKIAGFARMYYAPLHLNSVEIEEALSRAGL